MYIIFNRSKTNSKHYRFCGKTLKDGSNNVPKDWSDNEVFQKRVKQGIFSVKEESPQVEPKVEPKVEAKPKRVSRTRKKVEAVANVVS